MTQLGNIRTQLNNKTIAEIAQRTPTSEAFFTYAACRERNARDGITKIRAIRVQMVKEGFHPVPQDLLSMFRELERAQVGELKGDSFKWAIPIKSVGEAAEVKTINTAPTKIPLAKKNLVFYFAKDKEINLSFTANLSKDEISFVLEKLLQECE